MDDTADPARHWWTVVATVNSAARALVCRGWVWLSVLLILMTVASFLVDRETQIVHATILQDGILRALAASLGAALATAVSGVFLGPCPELAGMRGLGVLFVVGVIVSALIVYPALSFDGEIDPVFRVLGNSALGLLLLGLARHQMRDHSHLEEGDGQ